MGYFKQKKRINSQTFQFVFMVMAFFQIWTFYAMPTAFASESSSGLSPYFGTIPVFTENQISELRTFLKTIDDKACKKLGKECPAIDKFFSKFWGDIQNPNDPKLLIYVNENLEIGTNMLLWKNKVTPHLFGAQNIWVTIFSEEKLDLEARFTTLFKQRTFGRFGQKLFMPAEVTKKERETRSIAKPIRFTTLGKEDAENPLWIGIIQFYIETETASRISIYPKTTGTKVRKKVIVVHEDGVTTVETKEETERVEKESEEKTILPNFYRTDANFTNSRGSRLDFSVAIGATFDAEKEMLKDTHIGDTNIDLYFFAHLYLIRPKLLNPIKGRSYEPSYSLVAGTCLDLLDEIVVGLSVGHLFAKNGFIIGANIIDPFKEEYDDRKVRFFCAFDIKF